MQKSKRKLWEMHQQSLTRISQYKARKMVVYMDDDIIAINKPSGIPVHDGPGIRPGLALTSQLSLWQNNNAAPPSLAHRIDKNTTGILLLARHREAARKMENLFHEKKIIKNYCALCISVPLKDKGSIEIPLGSKNITTTNRRNAMHRVVLRPDRNDEFSEDRAGRTVSGQVKLAWTKYSLLSRSEDNCSLIDVKPVTGFRHQIRVHLADAIMCPVLGDYKFAGPLFRLNKSLAKKMDLIGSMPGYTRGPLYLHAYQVKIPRNDKESLIINAPFPEYFVKTTVALGLQFPSQFKKLLTEE